MARQYWVGDFLVDLSRNQITQNKKTQIVAPKVLAVLTCLAEHQGKVVSQEALLENVWQGSVVSANTLQRCIAQLRKALGDDGKAQAYIKTHSKQGYSLESEVRWHDCDDPEQNTGLEISIDKKPTIDKTSISEPVREGENSRQNKELEPSQSPGETIAAHKPSILRANLWLLFIFIFVTTLGFGFSYFSSQEASTLVVSGIRSLTATDDKEFDATYSPDGKYIVFHRYLDKLCVNKIWAKNLQTQQEFLLTKDWGAYGGHSFSKDGKKLVFLATQACSAPRRQKNCYDLVSLDFGKALGSPQQPSMMLQCKKSIIKKPIWLNNDTIALLQQQSRRWKIINYSVNDNTSLDIYSPAEGNIIDFNYSSKDDLIAIVRVDNKNQQHIDMMKPTGEVLSSYPIRLVAEIPQFLSIRPEFDPANKQLIFSTGRQLYTVSYEGTVKKISLPFTERMVLPKFHPAGKKLLMIKGPYDSDIALLPFSNISQPASLVSQNNVPEMPGRRYSVFERSIVGEDHAVFQPGGDFIAFWSERSGEHQVWLSNGSKSRQLTQFPVDTYIRDIAWAKDGKSILVNANMVLIRVYLDSTIKSVPLKHPVNKLLQWDSKDNHALLIARVDGISKYLEYDLESLEFEEILDGKVRWALKSENGSLIYKDELDRFWRPGPIEAVPIKALDGQGSKNNKFLIRGNTIYDINIDNQLWSYDLDSNNFKIIGQLSEELIHLSDINRTHILVTIKVAAKKEVVELLLGERSN